MKSVLFVVTAAVSIILTGPAIGAAPNCGTIQATVIAGHSFAVTEVCKAHTVTPWVYVNGHHLIVAEQSDRSQVATFYGFSAVVRVHTIHDRLVSITAGSVRPRSSHLRIRFAVKS